MGESIASDLLVGKDAKAVVSYLRGKIAGISEIEAVADVGFKLDALKRLLNKSGRYLVVAIKL